MDDVLPGHYGKVSLDDMQLVGAPVYRLSMIAEAYATKGTNSTHLLPPFILFFSWSVSTVTSAVTLFSTWWQHCTSTELTNQAALVSLEIMNEKLLNS